MTTKAIIKQAELNRLAAVAKRHGMTIEIETEQYKLRMYPSQQVSQDEEEPSSRGLLDIPYHEIPPEPVQPPLDHREAKAMGYLMAFGAEQPIDWYTLKNFGRHTKEKLQSRGYIAVSGETDRQGTPDQIWLTKAGQNAMRALDAHRSKYLVL